MPLVKAGQTQNTEQNFTVIIYGQPGIGKSTLAESATEPLLYDFDGGMHRVNAIHRGDYVSIGSYEDALEALEYPETKAAKSIVIDTGGALVNYLKDYVMRKYPDAKTKSGDFNGLKGFGHVKTEFENFTSRIRDILHKNCIVIFHSTEATAKDGSIVQRLQCEGSAKNLVWNACDFGGFMQYAGGKRTISFRGTDEYFAKGCHGITGTYNIPELGENDKNDFLTKLFEQARENIRQENEQSAGKRAEYESVMETVRALVDAVDDAESATAAAEEIKNMKHALTSLTEARALFARKCAQIGVKWNGNAYE